MKRWLLVLAVATLATAQEPASTRPEEAAVDELLRKWSETVTRGDAQALGDLITDDVEFWGDRTPGLKGKAAVISAFENTFQIYTVRHRFEERERVWDESFVVLRGIESTNISPKNILRGEEMRRRVFVVMRRDNDGRWRIARGMSNTPPLLQ